jgi:hypothetical protein
VVVVKICPQCEWDYDEQANADDRCMACQARAASPELLPAHQVLEEVNLHGRRYARLRYADSSENLALLRELPADARRWLESVQSRSRQPFRPSRRAPRHRLRCHR